MPTPKIQVGSTYLKLPSYTKGPRKYTREPPDYTENQPRLDIHIGGSGLDITITKMTNTCHL